MKEVQTNIEIMVENGMITRRHEISDHDQALINSLTAGEVEALIKIKNKLGVAFLKKTYKEGRFPVSHTSGF